MTERRDTSHDERHGLRPHYDKESMACSRYFYLTHGCASNAVSSEAGKKLPALDFLLFCLSQTRGRGGGDAHMCTRARTRILLQTNFCEKPLQPSLLHKTSDERQRNCLSYFPLALCSRPQTTRALSLRRTLPPRAPPTQNTHTRACPCAHTHKWFSKAGGRGADIP